MARILVVGSANIDRIWWLDRPLVSSGRPFYERIESRLGGGGFNTGSALLALGHEVLLATTLFDDDKGRAILATLDACGFDTRFIAFVPGESIETEILIDPQGERTIIGRAGTGRKPVMAELPRVEAAAIYLNSRRMSATATSGLARFPHVVSQFPLSPGEIRPADVLIASRSDVSGPADTLWRDARERAGQRLSQLVLTDGSKPVCVIERGEQVEVPVPPIGPVRDTTGAGDAFAAGYIDGILRGPDTAAIAARRGNEAAAAWLSKDGKEPGGRTMAAM
ncbi:MAG TPA: PfkB family carbohydrate kinase [Devosiaceae bacterium]|nr:PfkB family carbohydrate kinase [Devosiaceae bacterium]